MAGKGDTYRPVDIKRYENTINNIKWPCRECNKTGLVSDPQHGHSLRCPRCDGKGYYKK